MTAISADRDKIVAQIEASVRKYVMAKHVEDETPRGSEMQARRFVSAVHQKDFKRAAELYADAAERLAEVIECQQATSVARRELLELLVKVFPSQALHDL